MTLYDRTKTLRPGTQTAREKPVSNEQAERFPTDPESELFMQRYLGNAAMQAEAEDGASVPPIVEDVLRSPGQPLDPTTREFMESRFGHDFSGVRVHADDKAAESARAVNALAYTVGRDVVFGSGQYASETDGGRQLLAHELTHVIQQSAVANLGQHQLTIGRDDDHLESEAERISINTEKLDTSIRSSAAGQYKSNRKISAGMAPSFTVQRQLITPLGAGGGFGGLMERDRQRSEPAVHSELSFELQDAPYQSVPTSLPHLTETQMRVLGWLRLHREEIIAAEQEYRVDRRAIAGAIAWEALRNVRSWSFRAVGPAKIHTWDFNPFKETILEETVKAGYAPHMTSKQRVEALKTPSGAITHIAAIMAAIADIAAANSTTYYDIRCNPPILTNVFQGSNLSEWKEHLKKKQPGEPLKPANLMAVWVGNNLSYLEEAVGRPNLPESCGLPTAAELAKDLISNNPTTNQQYADWVLKAVAQGFAECTSTNTKKNLEDLKGGTKIGSIAPASEKVIGGLRVMADLVKGAINAWLKAGASSPKRVIYLGSFVRASDTYGYHKTGGAIDTQTKLDFEKSNTVNQLIDILDSLSPGHYELGFPFQGEFFPSENEMTWVDAEHKEKGLKPPSDTSVKTVSDVLIRFASHIYTVTHDEKKGVWIPSISDANQAYTLIKSEKLKAKLSEMKSTKSFSLVIFPDNPRHLHIGVIG